MNFSDETERAPERPREREKSVTEHLPAKRVELEIDHEEKPTEDFPPLPAWLEKRVLEEDETVTWVGGPRSNPSWERAITHPAMFLIVLLIVGATLGVARLIHGSWDRLPLAFWVAGVVSLLVCVLILGIGSGFFTRMIVTNRRIIVVQGVEVCRDWPLSALPSSLIRHQEDEDEEGKVSQTVDLDALKTALGTSNDQFIDGKTLMSFGKQLKEMKRREDRE